jgi:hypothetical protein
MCAVNTDLIERLGIAPGSFDVSIASSRVLREASESQRPTTSRTSVRGSSSSTSSPDVGRLPTPSITRG